MREILRRRVPQIIGAYLATSWIFLEFTSWAVFVKKYRTELATRKKSGCWIS